jgi:hypothetical protein
VAANDPEVEGLQVLFLQQRLEEPPHVHIDHSGRTTKVWLQTLKVAYNDGYPIREITAILSVVDEKREQLLRAWHGYFDD